MQSGQSQTIEELNSTSVKALNESFNFDWNDFRTIEPNKTKIPTLELFIEKSLPSLDMLEESARYAFAQLCFKLGTFYIHIERNPAPALEKLLISEKILTGTELAWVKNHIAFSFQQKIAASKKEKNLENVKENAALAIEYCNQLTNQYANAQETHALKIIGFADLVKALVEYETDTAANLTFLLETYKKTYEIFRGTDDEQSQFIQEISKTILAVQEKIAQSSFNLLLDKLVREVVTLPFEAREIVIESFSTVLLRGLVPMSGMTIQQHLAADPFLLDRLNQLTKKSDAYKNGTDARYVYQFAREASSAGIVPAYRNKITGDIYVALICNKRNTEMYNWSAGYTEAPLPGWRGKLESEKEHEIYYDPVKIKDSATHTIKKALEAAEGDWTRVNYDYQQFEQGFKASGVTLPKIDLNSFHTASRECLEELNLDLTQFPQRKTFLISHDNTVGISQGDASGQTSNRSHQYMVYLGDLDEQPTIKPGDDVAFADWINVSDIQRKNSTEYAANQKPLCIYMLRGLELGLKYLWYVLLQNESLQLSRYNRKSVSRFSSPENLAAEIESFSDKQGINLAGTNIIPFLQSLSGDMPSKTYTGKSAQAILNCLLGVAKYLMSPGLNSETFVKDMTELLAPLNEPSSVFSSAVNLLHFKPAPELKSDAMDTALLQAPKFGMNGSQEN